MSGDTSQRRFDGLTPGSKPSDGHFFFSVKVLGLKYTGLRLLRVNVVLVGLGIGLGVRLLAFLIPL